MVTEQQVWDALAEIPDPEIPVISLVDLGVIRSVDVSRDQVRVEFTPTFLGCPALEVMRDAMTDRITALGAEPDVQVISDDSWSTDRITPEGREKDLRTPRSRTSSGPRPAAQCAIAAVAGNRSSSSKRSDGRSATSRTVEITSSTGQPLER